MNEAFEVFANVRQSPFGRVAQRKGAKTEIDPQCKVPKKPSGYSDQGRCED